MGPKIVAAFIEVNMNMKHMTITWKQIKEAILFKRSSAKAAKADANALPPPPPPPPPLPPPAAHAEAGDAAAVGEAMTDVY